MINIDLVLSREYNMHSEEFDMDYATTDEMSLKWGITRRRITKLCNEG